MAQFLQQDLLDTRGHGIDITVGAAERFLDNPVDQAEFLQTF